ncbi:phosphotransferase [Candidatus Uhrbacteria bacterium]|nr:phosphotransferase [Candidatus Uhrbacteria bacterium]
MTWHDQQPDKGELSARLEKLFDLGALDDVELLVGGFLCQNFTLCIGAQRFFLKQYRHKLSQVVHQVKYAEELFASQGVPVLSPLKDRFNRGAFFFDHNWYSLFPFIDREAVTIQELTDVGRETLAGQLAAMHLIGRRVKKSIQPLLLWDKDRFFLEVAELEMRLEEVGVESPVHALIAKVIAQKKRFVEQNTFTPEAADLPFDTLLHGDFSYQNVFFSPAQDRIDYLFDFEKTCRGPRAFELARALFVDAFDDGWEEGHLKRAAIFLRRYLQTYPIPTEEFVLGVRMYLVHVAHQLWIEGKILLRDGKNYIPILQAHSYRVEHVLDDLESFARALYARALADG